MLVRVHTYMDDAHHDHVTLTKFANRTNTLYQQRLHLFSLLLPSRSTWFNLAKWPEAPKPKGERIRQLF